MTATWRRESWKFEFRWFASFGIVRMGKATREEILDALEFKLESPEAIKAKLEAEWLRISPGGRKELSPREWAM